MKKLINILSHIIYYVCFIWLFKSVRKSIFNLRKKNAIEKANKFHAENPKKTYHVIQIERRFIVGNREELKRFCKGADKFVKWRGKSRYYNCDYRRAIIYSTKN